jgi:hypothetical protein
MKGWVPDPPSLGPFSFRPGGSRSFAGGMAHLPGETGRVAFLRPGPLPEGWVPGSAPPMDAETWSRWAKAMQRELEAKRARDRDPWK